MGVCSLRSFYKLNDSSTPGRKSQLLLYSSGNGEEAPTTLLHVCSLTFINQLTRTDVRGDQLNGDAKPLTCTLELVGGCGEQQFTLHAPRPSAAGDARLLVTALHPVGQPEEAAVAVQRVGSYRSEGDTEQRSEVDGGGGELPAQLWSNTQ